jgi:AcrR family transcriptional regulator
MRNDDKKQKIIKAVERLAKTHTFEELKLDEVAKVAKVGKGTLYLYFKDKTDLFRQVTMNGWDELCVLIEKHAESDVPFNEKLYTVCQAISDFFVHRGSLLRLMHEFEVRSGAHREFRKNNEKGKILSVLTKIIEQGIAGNLITDSISVENQAVFLTGLLRTRDWSFKHHEMEAPPVKMAVDIFLKGVSA